MRTGRREDVSRYPDLHAGKAKGRRGVSAEEWVQSVRIEDPIEISRDLADVYDSIDLWFINPK